MSSLSGSAAAWSILCIIGTIQGITEFLPISSSAHLVFSQYLLGVSAPGLSIEVFAHLGTLCAVLLVFRRDVSGLLKGFCYLVGVRRPTRGDAASLTANESYARLLILIVAGSVPAAVFGFAFSDSIAAAFESVVWPSTFLVVNGLLLLSGQWALGNRDFLPRGFRRKEIQEIAIADAILVGVAQAAAIFPGISRSGATVSAGIWRGIDRRAAASFSFLLSIPAVLGAAVFDILELSSRSLSGAVGTEADMPAGVGPTGVAIGGLPVEMLVLVAFVSFVTGALSILFFLRLLDKGKLWGFAVYCLLLGSAVLAFSKGLGF